MIVQAALLPILLVSAGRGGGDGIGAEDPTARDELRAEYPALIDDLARARFEFGCDKSVEMDRLEFEAEYDARTRRVQRFYEEHFTPQEREEVLAPLNDNIMVGGCRRDRLGRSAMKGNEQFASKLRQVEKLVRRFEKEERRTKRIQSVAQADR